MEKKSFFKERDTHEIQELDVQKVYRARGLVDKIMSLDPEKEGISIQTVILPLDFLHPTAKERKERKEIMQKEAARKFFKHGYYLHLTQPETQSEAYALKAIPLELRQRDFTTKLQSMNEEEIFFIGYQWHPVQGRDRLTRRVFFPFLAEGDRVYAYAETKTGGIQLQPYVDAARVKQEGGEIVCSVPSRRKKLPRYKLNLQHVPVEGSTERRAVAWSLRAKYGSEDSGDSKGRAPEHEQYNIRYTWDFEREGSQQFTFYPHVIAAHRKVVKDYWSKHNFTPMEMSPLAFLSKKGIDFYNRLCNNVVIYDSTCNNSNGKKGGLRKLYLAEKAVLMSRSIGVLGAKEIMYWDGARDGRVEDYDWSIPQRADW